MKNINKHTSALVLAGGFESRHDGRVMRELRRLFGVVLPMGGGLLAAGALSGCGASFESIYESEVRFEHCYRLDLEPQSAPTHRLFCWQEWLETYSSEQSRDRLEYAERRVLALRNGDISRPTLLIGGTPTRSGAFELPADTTVAPPSIVPAGSASQPVDAPQTCQTACSDALNACRSLCEGACDRCVEEYRDCSERCVKQPAPDAGDPPAKK